MANIVRKGFGQVEPNHLSAQRTGQIYAQLPADGAINQLENGQFVKYDLKAGKINFTGKGEWMMVFNEVKLYDERLQSYKDYVMKKEDFVANEMVPRVFKVNIGDIFTTNTLKEAGKGHNADLAAVALEAGDLLKINAQGFLEKETALIDAAKAPVFEIAKIDTMPDGQAAVKVMRVK